MTSLRAWAIFCLLGGVLLSAATSISASAMGGGMIIMGLAHLAAWWADRRSWRRAMWLLAVGGFAGCGAITAVGVRREMAGLSANRK